MNTKEIIQDKIGKRASDELSKTPLVIRPYARLLTMLGEQLLKNERVALVELIKNSYDADAGRVDVMFLEFADDMTMKPESRIVVWDNGCGMTPEAIQQAWMNPATPIKFMAKRKGRWLTPERNRVIQGEKGIGRFAVLKLAKKISLTTRVRGANIETVVWLDFTRFDEDFVQEEGEEKEIFLDEITIDWGVREPEVLVGEEHGTIIEMEVLKGAWNERMIDRLCRDVANLTDPISRLTDKKATDTFEISVVCNNKEKIIAQTEGETLKSLIEDKAVFAISGQFLGEECAFHYDKGSGDEELSLYDERVKGLSIWRQRYTDKKGKQQVDKEQTYICGNFAFHFYIFDFARGIEGRYFLTQPEKNSLKQHRVYLYRDGVRVYPYGDPDDDWLNIDTSRGIGRAGDFFSNDQIIGWVDITHEGNPKLRDKTNREGLIETEGAAEDFVFLIGTFLSYIKRGPFQLYQMKQQQKNIAKAVREGVVAKNIANLKASLKKAGQIARVKEVEKIESLFKQEQSYLTRRAELTEDLAGVGLSVEMASHDIMLLMERARKIGINLAKHAQKESIESVREQADMLVGVLEQVVAGMQDVQSLFRSSRRRRKKLRVEPILDKIHGIYKEVLEDHKITYHKLVVGTSPLVAHTTDGVVMQLLINLFDNAAYWLETNAPDAPREIQVTLDGDMGELVFADTGPGVDADDKPYVFEAFFSGKGQEGRGLGLYIARQLLDRHEYTIDLADSSAGALSGANFVIRFVKEDG